MVRKAALMACLAIAGGCDRKPAELPDGWKIERGEPVGRYQASQDSKGDGLYVLDTTSGSVRFCVASTGNGPGGEGFAAVGVACTPSTK